MPTSLNYKDAHQRIICYKNTSIIAEIGEISYHIFIQCNTIKPFKKKITVLKGIS